MKRKCFQLRTKETAMTQHRKILFTISMLSIFAPIVSSSAHAASENNPVIPMNITKAAPLMMVHLDAIKKPIENKKNSICGLNQIELRIHTDISHVETVHAFVHDTSHFVSNTNTPVVKTFNGCIQNHTLFIDKRFTVYGSAQECGRNCTSIPFQHTTFAQHIKEGTPQEVGTCNLENGEITWNQDIITANRNDPNVWQECIGSKDYKSCFQKKCKDNYYYNMERSQNPNIVDAMKWRETFLFEQGITTVQR